MVALARISIDVGVLREGPQRLRYRGAVAPQLIEPGKGALIPAALAVADPTRLFNTVVLCATFQTRQVTRIDLVIVQ